MSKYLLLICFFAIISEVSLQDITGKIENMLSILYVIAFMKVIYRLLFDLRSFDMANGNNSLIFWFFPMICRGRRSNIGDYPIFNIVGFSEWRWYKYLRVIQFKHLFIMFEPLCKFSLTITKPYIRRFFLGLARFILDAMSSKY